MDTAAMRRRLALRRRVLAAAVLAAAALAGAGCGGPTYVYFRPAENVRGAGAGWVAKAVYDLPPESRQVAVEVSARGTVETPEGGTTRERLSVLLAVRNRGEASFALDPAQVRLLDDEGRELAGAQAYAGRNRTGAIAIAGGAEAAYELVFDLPATIRFDRLGSVRIAWPYRYGDKAYEGATKFICIDEVNYYYPTPYYYDPWYGDPWYGPHRRPWPRHRVGIGFSGGW